MSFESVFRVWWSTRSLGLGALKSCSQKKHPKWMMVGTFLKDHPLANLFVCRDCYQNVWPREYRLLKHRIESEPVESIPLHVVDRYEYLQSRIKKKNGYVLAWLARNKEKRNQQAVNVSEFARTEWKNRECAKIDSTWKKSTRNKVETTILGTHKEPRLLGRS